MKRIAYSLGIFLAIAIGLYSFLRPNNPWLILQIDEELTHENTYINICGTKHLIRTVIYYALDECEGTIFIQDAQGNKLSQEIYITGGIQVNIQIQSDGRVAKIYYKSFGSLD